MVVLITGGVKNGKSMLAQRLARFWGENTADGRLFYLATMSPADDEDRARIQKHREDRAGWGFETLEAAQSFAGILPLLRATDTLLLDSVTAFLANVMFGGDRTGEPVVTVVNHITAVCAICENVLIVSDDIFADAALYPAEVETYRACLGQIQRQLAEIADAVVECTAGGLNLLKGAAVLQPVLDKLAGADAAGEGGVWL